MVVGGGHRWETTNSSSELVRDVDQAQYQDSAGPCVEAIRTGKEVAIAFPTDRWPVFAQRATADGACSVLSLPLKVKGRTTGALNLYSVSVSALEAPMVDASRRLAAEAAFVLAQAAALMSAELVNQHLQEALATRDVIGQAKGILMVRHGIRAEEAFTMLRQTSQDCHRKLHDVATEVVAELQRPTDPS
jgi:transcriptional regulator with GAF, ATPase, and Fis domain